VTVVSTVESMEDSGLVSVVIPTKDRPEMLRRAVVSVIGQAYTPVELIVVDDGSADPAREAIGDLDTENLERLGPARAPRYEAGAKPGTAPEGQPLCVSRGTHETLTEANLRH
jgi:glycosyltransferase involved in cell wall biosynthesis